MTSDIVLTGHEHEGRHYEVHLPGPEQEVHYIEGAILQDSHDAKHSAFHVVVIDFDASSYTVTQYTWDGERYSAGPTASPAPFVRNRARLRSRFDVSPEFYRTLDDPGRDLHHSRKRNLELHDLFVYPQLRERSMNAQLAASRGKAPLIDSGAVLNHVVKSERVLILAPGDAGKTSLCRMLFRDLRLQKDLVPVLLGGHDIMGHQYESLIAAVKPAFSRQYRPEEFEAYQQLEKKERVLVVDDFHKYRLNVKAKAALIKAASQFFGITVLVGDQILQYEELADEEERGTTPYVDFSRCEVQPFGFKLREKIIRRWVELGREYTTEPDEIDFEVRQWELVVNTLLGANVIPAYPLTLLVMLQTGQAAQNHALVSGAYGYVYEALITRSIASVGEEATDTDTKYAFLSWLAYGWFREEKTSAPEAELLASTRTYLDQIDLDLAADHLIGELLRSEVLERAGTDIRFRYPYYLHYFTARYLRDALTSGSDVLTVRATLRMLADNLYYQPYANILVIYFYLNRDTELIEYVLDQARHILEEHRACDLESDVDFLNRLDLSAGPRALPSAKPAENRDRYLDEVDAAGGEEPVFTALPEKIQYSEGLHPYLKFDIAFKALQVMGQVLRNFPGSLSGGLKIRLAEECYGLGLRVLQAIVGSLEDSYDEFKDHVEALIRERRQIAPDVPMPRTADKFILWLCLGCSFGVVKRLSEATGHQRLRRTYEEVVKRAGDNVAIRLIDFSIRLDQFGEVSETRIEDLKKRLRHDPFAFRLLQDIGFYHMSMWAMTTKSRQRLAQLLELDGSAPRLLDSRTRLLPRRAPTKS